MASEGTRTNPTRRQTVTDFVKSSADVVRPALLLLEQVGEAGNISVLKGIAGVTGLILDICDVGAA
jgi:hypothetical protein